jgi:hypothetical protein
MALAGTYAYYKKDSNGRSEQTQLKISRERKSKHCVQIVSV